jgi:hypothetical protein
MRPSQGGQGKQKQGHQSANKDVVHSSKELKWKKGSRGSGIQPISASTQRHAQALTGQALKKSHLKSDDQRLGRTQWPLKKDGNNGSRAA